MPDIVGFAGLLAQKYALLQQHESDAHLEAMANANLANTRAGLLPAESKAGIGLTGAQATEALARGRNLDVTTQLAPSLARSSIGLNSAQAGESRARANTLNSASAYGLSVDGTYGTTPGADIATRLGLSQKDFYRFRL